MLELITYLLNWSATCAIKWVNTSLSPANKQTKYVEFTHVKSSYEIDFKLKIWKK